MRALTRLELKHPTGATPIHVGVGALEEAASEIGRDVAGGRVFVVTTRVVRDLHASALDGLGAAVGSPRILEVPEGEAAKRLEVAGSLWSDLVRAGAKRDSTLIAVGGGSVSDLTGFVAGALVRGVGWIAVPTTLLGQVDAAIGGKTAVDLPEAKNAIGLFHHPTRVICDTSFLPTLPARELRSGLSEVIKIAGLLDVDLLLDLERSFERLEGGDPAALAPVVARAVELKARLVAEDPADRGRRGWLNFGHTLGHALEAALGYRHLTHGEAVAYGMLFSLRLAGRRGMPREDTARLRALIDRLRLPSLPELRSGDLIERMSVDKKARESGLRWIVPERLGGGADLVTIPMEEVEQELGPFLAGAG